MTINITTTRRAGHSDQAILDLLQLDQIGVIPSRIRVTRLELLGKVRTEMDRQLPACRLEVQP